MVEIVRQRAQQKLLELLKDYPVVAVLGPRQVGKTTLVSQLSGQLPEPVHSFDLEDPQDAAALAEPGVSLRHLRGTVILDEVHHAPDIFKFLRVLADRRPLPARFIVLGSASPELLRQSSESLAGRLGLFELAGFAMEELHADAGHQLWHRGGFPASYLAATERKSALWRQNFVRTYLARDLPQLGLRTSPTTLLRFWTMLAHYHGQPWNGAEFARSFAVSATTVRSYLDLLTSLYLVQQLQPYAINLSKRLVKAPKIYLRDTGLLHILLGIENSESLATHPKIGASFEGFALEALIQALQLHQEDIFFWRTQNGAEIDLVFMHRGRLLGCEIKYTDAPRITPSMRSAVSDLRLDHCYVLHAGSRKTYPLNDHITAVSIWRLGAQGLAAMAAE